MPPLPGLEWSAVPLVRRSACPFRVLCERVGGATDGAYPGCGSRLVGDPSLRLKNGSVRDDAHGFLFAFQNFPAYETAEGFSSAASVRLPRPVKLNPRIQRHTQGVSLLRMNPTTTLRRRFGEPSAEIARGLSLAGPTVFRTDFLPADFHRGRAFSSGSWEGGSSSRRGSEGRLTQHTHGAEAD